MAELPRDFRDPPAECSLCPFWFWNDDLSESTIRQQIDAMVDRRVGQFVLHPRVGLPRSCRFMSPELLGFMRVAVEHAADRGMRVVLYDEGMYPSGSAGGLVVAENPEFACRGLAPQRLPAGEEPELKSDQRLVALVDLPDGGRLAVIDTPVGSHIRGLHYHDHDAPRSDRPWHERATPEDQPPAADPLNPDAVAAFIRIVYDGYHAALGDHLGSTIPAMFTDEPMLLGRGAARDARPGSAAVLEKVNDELGYDFRPHLPALWIDDWPHARPLRRDYHHAVQRIFRRTYYQPLADWCDARGIALTGHPKEPGDIAHLRCFHWPGQDIVWDYVTPGDKALDGPQATQAKCAASAMAHARRRRNVNEFMGAFGHDVTLERYKWTADWLLTRGCNLLMPHAYFYSIRGPRIDESPPQLGPHARFWDDPQLVTFHDYCARLCWLNTDSQPVCRVAILGLDDVLPWRAARVCFEHQIDFHYLEASRLAGDAIIARDGVYLADQRYQAVVVDAIGAPGSVRPKLAQLAEWGRVIAFDPPAGLALPPHAAVAATPDALVAALDSVIDRDIFVEPRCPGLRARHVIKAGDHWYLFHNESGDPIDAAVHLGADGERLGIDPMTLTTAPLGRIPRLMLPPYATAIVRVAQSTG